MVWSTQAVDKITVPASVPIGPGQDGVILSGADIPSELRSVGVTAAIIFQRGAFPSLTGYEAKYYFIALENLTPPVGGGSGSGSSNFSIGAVVDDKAGTLRVVQHIRFAVGYYNTASLGVQLVAKPVQFTGMDFTLDVGNHSTQSSITAYLTTAQAGQTLTAAGWYNVALNSGWINPPADPHWPAGVEWKPTADGVIILRGQVQCNTATPVNSVICNIGKNQGFKTFPSFFHPFISEWYVPGTASTGSCLITVSTTGDVTVGGTITPPTNGAILRFSTTFYGEL